MEEQQAKQVIVFRKDLLKGDKSIRKGKFASQCCHASLGALLQCAKKTEIMEPNGQTDEFEDIGTEYKIECLKNSYLDKWLNGIFTKITLSVDNEEELLGLYEKIKNEAPQIPCVLITDCGLTEFHGEATNTCIGIGPYWAHEIDNFTSNLKLL